MNHKRTENGLNQVCVLVCQKHATSSLITVFKFCDFFVYSKLLSAKKTPKNSFYMYYILHNNAHKDIDA